MESYNEVFLEKSNKEYAEEGWESIKGREWGIIFDNEKSDNEVESLQEMEKGFKSSIGSSKLVERMIKILRSSPTTRARRGKSSQIHKLWILR